MLKLKSPRKLVAGELARPGIEESRDSAILQYPIESLAQMNSARAAELQRLLQHGTTFGVWETRRDWLSPGAKNVNVDLRKRILHFLPQEVKERSGLSLDSLLESAVLTLVRYLCLLRMGPSGKGRDSFRALSPSFVRDIAFSYGPPLIALAVTKRLTIVRVGSGHADPDDASQTADLLSGLTLDDLSTLTKNAHKKIVQECNRMEMLEHHGLWTDTPALTDRSLSRTMVGPALSREAPRPRDSHRPLPDKYVAELGTRGIWLIEDLAPNLFEIGERLVEIWRESDRPHYARETVRDSRGEKVRELLSTYEWRGSDGKRFDEPPFILNLPKEVGFGRKSVNASNKVERQWPPANFRDFKGLLTMVQAAHMCVGLLSIGPRRSEILSFKRDCIVYATNGRPYANGRTFKLVSRHDGKTRDWLLPDMAVRAFEQQVRLIALAEKLNRQVPQREPKNDGNKGTNHLWGQISVSSFSDAFLPLNDVNPLLISYAKSLYIDIAPGDQNLRSHRFRKTLGRLVALALTQAPRLLMQIFGHKSIEMTLYYILEDKDLAAEIETVSRELRVMQAKEVVEKMVAADAAGEDVHGGYGGPAAISIHNAIGKQRQRLHRAGKDWEISSSMELAELLTLQGKAWDQVRRGVMCTKYAGETGPCNKSKGRPEPSKCQSRCTHRLEETFLREDLDGSIHDSIISYQKAIADQDSLIAAHWAAQVRAHVPRFPDLQNKWMLHPTVKELMTQKIPGGTPCET